MLRQPQILQTSNQTRLRGTLVQGGTLTHEAHPAK
jgi:hypothetical protein